MNQTEEQTSRSIKSILDEFVKPQSPITQINIGEIETRLRDGINPLDVTPDGYFDMYSDPFPKNGQIEKDSLAVSLTRFQRIFTAPIYEFLDTAQAFSRIYGFSKFPRAA